MRKDLLIIALGLLLPAGPVAADVLAVPPEDPAGQPAILLPAKGTTMADVQKKFGQPRAKQPTVGGDAPKHPPITRWDYDGFVVIFEHDRVVDAVIPGAPPKIYHKDRLQPATAKAPPALPPVPAPEEMPEEAPMAPEGAPDAGMGDDEMHEAPPMESTAEGGMQAMDAQPPDDMMTDDAPESAEPDRPTPAEAPEEETPEDSPPTPR